MSLGNKTAVVTGGGSGIGAAIAVSLATNGCRVAIAGRREERLLEVAARFDGAPAILTHVADVADRDSVAELFAWAESELGQIDILVNSAGINVPRRSLEEVSAEDWDKVLAVNVSGAFNCIQAVLPQMRKRKDGVIVNIGSVAGLRAGLIGGAAYNASKFAMSALGRTVGVECCEEGIRVTNIYPGEVETPILDDRPVPVPAEHRGRILQPVDVAAAVQMVVELPSRANVAELVIKPTIQAFS